MVGIRFAKVTILSDITKYVFRFFVIKLILSMAKDGDEISHDSIGNGLERCWGETGMSESIPPVIPIQTSIINCFRQMSGLDVFAAVEVGNGAGNLEDSVVCTRGESKPIHGVFEHVATCFIQVAILLDKLRGHLRIGVDGRIGCIAFLLNLSRFDDTLTHCRT